MLPAVVPASHFLFMVAYALLVSIVFATLLKDQRREQLKTGAVMFGTFVAAAVVFGWLMYPFPL
jgi:4-amino-4-deoxy-L-arabinose transferase-like glycosyltransferase